MKVFYTFLALVTLMFASKPLHADDISATLLTGTSVDALVVTTPIVAGVQEDVFTYVNETIGLLGYGGDVLSSSTSTFIATYTDVSGVLGLLNVTDACVNVDIIGPATKCQSFAFSLTNLSLADASLIADVGIGVSANVNANVANFDVASASIGGGSGTFNFTTPPGGGGNPSPVPEPASLSLMATGLLGAAGAIRRRFTATKA